MSIRRVKDKTGLVAEARVVSRNFRPHYFTAYLWRDQTRLIAATYGMDERTRACCCFNDWDMLGDGTHHLYPKVGELHFVMGDWDEEVVAHEVQHAMLHMVRCLAGHIMANPEDQTGDRMETEERFCLDAGRWVRDLYHWLWQHDPSERWQRVEAPEAET